MFSGRKIASFNNLQIFEIYSMIMDNLTAVKETHNLNKNNRENMYKQEKIVILGIWPNY